MNDEERNVSVSDLDREASAGQPGARLFIGRYKSERVAKAQATRFLNSNPHDSRRPFFVKIVRTPTMPGRFVWSLFISWGTVAELDRKEAKR